MYITPPPSSQSWVTLMNPKQSTKSQPKRKTKQVPKPAPKLATQPKAQSRVVRVQNRTDGTFARVHPATHHHAVHNILGPAWMQRIPPAVSAHGGNARAYHTIRSTAFTTLTLAEGFSAVFVPLTRSNEFAFAVSLFPTADLSANWIVDPSSWANRNLVWPSANGATGQVGGVRFPGSPLKAPSATSLVQHGGGNLIVSTHVPSLHQATIRSIGPDEYPLITGRQEVASQNAGDAGMCTTGNGDPILAYDNVRLRYGAGLGAVGEQVLPRFVNSAETIVTEITIPNTDRHGWIDLWSVCNVQNGAAAGEIASSGPYSGLIAGQGLILVSATTGNCTLVAKCTQVYHQQIDVNNANSQPLVGLATNHTTTLLANEGRSLQSGSGSTEKTCAANRIQKGFDAGGDPASHMSAATCLQQASGPGSTPGTLYANKDVVKHTEEPSTFKQVLNAISGALAFGRTALGVAQDVGPAVADAQAITGSLAKLLNTSTAEAAIGAGRIAGLIM